MHYSRVYPRQDTLLDCFALLVQFDTVLSRLTTLKERIDGTEALLEIDLDHRRNELVAFDLVSSHNCT